MQTNNKPNHKYDDYDEIKQELEKYKIENYSLRMSVEKVKNTLSFRLGYILLHAFKSSENFTNLPKDLWNLKKLSKIKKEKHSEKIIFCRHDRFILRDKYVNATLHTKLKGKYSLQGTIYAIENEKPNAAIVVVSFSNITSSLEAAKRIGLSWSDKVGMYFYIQTNKSVSKFEKDITIPDNCGPMTLKVRRWYSKYDVKLSGIMYLEKYSLNENIKIEDIKKIEAAFDKKNVNKFLTETVKLKNVSVESKNIALCNIIKSLDCTYRNIIVDLLCEIDVARLTRLDNNRLIQHLINEGLYRELISKFSTSSDKVIKNQISTIRENLKLLDNGYRFPKSYPPKYTPIPKTSICLLHCSLPHHSNGYATRSHSVLKALSERNSYKVNVLTRQGYPWDVKLKEWPTTTLTHNIGGIIYRHIPGLPQRESSIIEYVNSASINIENRALIDKPQVIHACSNYLNAMPALLAARRLGVPFVYEVRGFWEVTEASRKPSWTESDKYKLDKQLENAVMCEADAIVTLTESMKQEIAARGINKDKIFIAPNAVNTEKFKSKPKNLTLAKELGLEDVVTIGYIGSIVPYEGLDDLLIAAKSILDKGVKINVLIVGDGSALASLKDMANVLNIETAVTFTGRVPHEEVLDYYSLIDIAPFPRKAFEVCELVSPLKPFEAMALQTPVVASNVNAIAEFMIDEVNGLLFEKGNIKSLTEQLLKLINNDIQRKEISQSAYKWVTKNRIWDRTAEEIEKAYSFAINNSNERILSSAMITNFNTVFSTDISSSDSIDLDEGVECQFLVDENSKYHVCGNLFFSKKETFRAAVVRFDFGVVLTKEQTESLGLSYSEKIGPFRYLVKNDNKFRLDFRTPSGSMSVNLKFEYWQPCGKISISNRIDINKTYNDKDASTQCFKKSKDSHLNIALYGDMNTNLIDGSSIWLASLAVCLSRLNNINVHVFLKDQIRSSEVLEQALNLENVYFIEPKNGKLNAKSIVESFRDYEVEHGTFDAIIVRGADACESFAASGFVDGRLLPYLTDIPQQSRDLTDEWKNRIANILYSSRLVLCQTQEFQSYFIQNFNYTKTSIVPPMIPDQEIKAISRSRNSPQKIFYAGKFSPEWGIRELFQVFNRLKQSMPDIELHVYGDKIHNPKDAPEFHDYVLNTLKSTNGLIWHGRASRTEVLTALSQADIAWAWRHSSLEDYTHELSTKLLEYGLAGVPVIINRSSLYIKNLGSDYPLFGENIDKLVDLCLEVFSENDRSRYLSKLSDLCEQHKFSYVAKRHLAAIFDDNSEKPKETILIAGHDLKFFTSLEANFRSQGYNVLVDKWSGHNKHDEKHSRDLIGKADIIICEWCLGNAVWYSKNKCVNQKLFIRFHLQEIGLSYPIDMDMSNIDKIIFVSHHLKRNVLRKFGWDDSEKLVVVPNYSKSELLDKPKVEGAEFNLGIVGIVPERKRFDLALDILEKLRKEDKRYQLFVKGKIHTDFPWMMNRPEEIKYYDEQMLRIKNSKLLEGAVHFDGFSNNMADWYRKIGYVLSTSDFESFHLTVADGAASGSIPIVLPWEGANEIYSDKFVVSDTTQASLKIMTINNNSFSPQAQYYKQYIHSNYTLKNVVDNWNGIIK